MKKFIKLLIICILILSMMLSASCDILKLKGTEKNSGGNVSQLAEAPDASFEKLLDEILIYELTEYSMEINY